MFVCDYLRRKRKGCSDELVLLLGEEQAKHFEDEVIEVY